MSIHVALSHTTRYHYDRDVRLSPHLVRLRPAPHCRTPILSYSQRITPAGHFLNWQQDPQSNYVARVTFPDKVRELLVEIDLVAGHVASAPSLHGAPQHRARRPALAQSLNQGPSQQSVKVRLRIDAFWDRWIGPLDRAVNRG